MTLIDRDVLIKRFCGHCIDYGKCEEKCFDMEIIESIPPVDAEPVVRCKVCANRRKCNHSVTMRLRTGITDCPVQFCSDGRREKK